MEKLKQHKSKRKKHYLLRLAPGVFRAWARGGRANEENSDCENSARSMLLQVRLELVESSVPTVRPSLDDERKECLGGGGAKLNSERTVIVIKSLKSMRINVDG